MTTRFKLSMLPDLAAGHDAQLDPATRQQIDRSEKLASLGRLAAGVAHEINNPLTGVLTFAHLLRDKPNMDDQDREDLDLIIRETTRAAEIVRRLLDFSRERAVIIERLEINEVVRRTMQLIRNQKLFDGIVIDERLAENLPEIDGDMNRLQQVLLNLTLNSCEAMPDGGTITVATSRTGDGVCVEIADTGNGIKPEVMERIFEPFFTTKPVGQGTGLGLAVSYGIIQQHGGSIEVESEPGKGTKFIITLPIEKT
jgi:two-component system NtrC family sensor kinase